MTRDSASIEYARSVLEAAEREWGNRLITAPNLPFHPASTYAETHFALAATALALLDPSASRWLDVAASRLELWNGHRGPATFFNAMATCLIRIALQRAGVRHEALDRVLDTIVARTHEHRHVAYGQWSGNNCYLQQVVVDLVLLPLARGQTLAPGVPATVAAEFLRYRTPEGFFFDLPRESDAQERLAPPTYVMKMLFLLGLCQELAADASFADLFRQGMSASLPLLTRQGSFCYFGRTDNSPFAAGLTIFNLRQAGGLGPGGGDFAAAAQRADVYFRTFPRTAAGLLQCNRFGTGTPQELVRSRDMYAKVGEYSVAACAYALLAYWLFPQQPGAGDVGAAARPATAASKDLGVLRLSNGDDELLLRTTGELTSWDRRYLAPTILRFEAGGELVVGAIAKTVSTDDGIEPAGHASGLAAKVAALKSWYAHGLEQLDATAVGFVPIVRAGAVDYLPYRVRLLTTNGSSVEIRYSMLRLQVRGLAACAIELRERIRRRLPWLERGEYGRPFMRDDDSFECARTVTLASGECRIHDRISGPLRGKTILLSTRSFAASEVRVAGLTRQRSLTGWGSDGRQELVVYAGRTDADVIDYECVVARVR